MITGLLPRKAPNFLEIKKKRKKSPLCDHELPHSCKRLRGLEGTARAKCEVGSEQCSYFRTREKERGGGPSGCVVISGREVPRGGRPAQPHAVSLENAAVGAREGPGLAGPTAPLTGVTEPRPAPALDAAQRCAPAERGRLRGIQIWLFSLRGAGRILSL